MEENNVSAVKQTATDDKVSGVFNIQFILTSLILNWKWYLLSLIICVGCAMVYLRYASPVYSISAKMLIKDDDTPQASRRGSALQNVANLGFMTNTSGFDNELEMLKSQSLSIAAVTDLKLYVNYFGVARFKKQLLYKNQPINVDMDIKHVNELEAPVNVDIESAGNNKFNIKIDYMYVDPDTEQLIPIQITKTAQTLPCVINTKVGIVTFNPNGRSFVAMSKIKHMKAIISNPSGAGIKYAFGLGVEPSSKTTTIANLSLNDGSVQRGIDYLNQLAVVYNRQANEDKNEIARRTDEFINDRLAKINEELNVTDGNIESYKRSKSVIDVTAKAAQSLTNTNSYERDLAAANTQLALLRSIQDVVNQPANKYQILPSNVGLTDAASVALITEYNKGVLERNRLLRNASEMNPKVQEMNGQLDQLLESLKSALIQAIRNGEISRDAMARQVAKFSGQISQTPEQERVLTQIGRKQEVTSGLYLMLLQKREENSISLAATADKGKLIDTPVSGGKVKPRNSAIMLGAIVLGFALPFFIFVLIELLRYRIEGHSDVEKLTKLPIIADVAMANMRITDAGWATFYAPFAVDMPAGVKAYTGEMQDGWIRMNELTKGYIPANTGVVVELVEGEPFESDLVPSAEQPNEVVLSCYTGNTTGTTMAMEVGDYLLQKQNDVVGWYKVEGEGFTLARNRCYLSKDDVPAPNQSRTFFGFAPDDATGINSIATEAKTKADGKYMVNGQIVVVKAGKAYNMSGAEIK